MNRATSLVIILVFTIINLRLSESRIFMTPNAWLLNEETPKNVLENLKPVSSLYGNTGYGVFEGGVEKWEEFWLKINIPNIHGSYE